MKYGIYIGANVKKGDDQRMAEAIATVMKASFETHADQKTTRVAIRSLRDAFSVNNTTISGCHLQGR